LLIANKYECDSPFDNITFARLFDLEHKEMNRCEEVVFEQLGANCSVTNDALHQTLAILQAQPATNPKPQPAANTTTTTTTVSSPPPKQTASDAGLPTDAQPPHKKVRRSP
jgi:hypothetical protein